MRMLFILEDLSSGGAQRQMYNIALAMQARGHQVEFFYFQPGEFFVGPLKEAGIAVHFHQKRSRYTVDLILALRKLIQDGHFDIVMSFLSSPNFYAVASTRFMRKQPVVIVSERLADPEGPVPWQIDLARQGYRWANYVTTNSNYQRLQMLKRYGFLKDRVTTIYNGYDLERAYPPEQEPPDDPQKLLVIGRVVPNKNALCLIKALAILRDQYAMCPQVDWVGEHFDHHTQELNTAIAELKLEGQWNWLNQRNDIVQLLHQHHALVHPSYNEGLSNVICEALASGRPVIASDLQDNPYLVQDGVSGYLFDWQSPEDLARVIAKLFRLSPQDRAEMGKQGRLFAEQNLSLTRLADEYEGLFTRLGSR